MRQSVAAAGDCPGCGPGAALIDRNRSGARGSSWPQVVDSISLAQLQGQAAERQRLRGHAQAREPEPADPEPDPAGQVHHVDLLA